MDEPLRLRVENNVDAIASAGRTATAWLAARQIPSDAVLLANLAIEELITNCIKFGYDDALVHVVEVTIQVEDGSLIVRVVDDGLPFDPMEAPPPDTSLPLEERPIGGLGIFLLRSLSDRMTYERTHGQNVITLVKALGAE